MELHFSIPSGVSIVSALSRTHVVHALLHKYPSIEWTGGKDLGIANRFRSKNQIGSFKSLTYMVLIHQKSGFKVWVQLGKV